MASVASSKDPIRQHDLEGVVPATAVTTVAYLIGRAYDEPQARSDTEAVLAIFEVAAVGQAQLEDALHNGFKDYEDGVAHAAALQAGCTSIVTRNGADFAASRLPVYTPAELLAALGQAG